MPEERLGLGLSHSVLIPEPFVEPPLSMRNGWWQQHTVYMGNFYCTHKLMHSDAPTTCKYLNGGYLSVKLGWSIILSHWSITEQITLSKYHTETIGRRYFLDVWNEIITDSQMHLCLHWLQGILLTCWDGQMTSIPCLFHFKKARETFALCADCIR